MSSFILISHYHTSFINNESLNQEVRLGGMFVILPEFSHP